MTKIELHRINHIFFIGIAGDGMSAVAQYLAGSGKNISGSDRQFTDKKKTKRQIQLENEGIKCFPQDSSGLTREIELVVISGAIEQTVPEYKSALKKGFPIIMRSDLLAAISVLKRTIAVAGTSGKSTVTAMIWHILKENGKDPSLITGAGLIDIQKTGRIGNAHTGKGEWLVIEADESDGSLVKYKPEIGIILNIDKDHKEISELEELFKIFSDNSKNVIVNKNDMRANALSRNNEHDFGEGNCNFCIKDFIQEMFEINFKIKQTCFHIKQPGKHNAENAAAAASAASFTGIDLPSISSALSKYKGIYRRHQIIGQYKGITIIDDYAHNPAKLSASIKACQFADSKLFVWFQPHGFKPTKFLRNEFVKEIADALRKSDQVFLSDIYYAGGTVSKDISSEELVFEIRKSGKNAQYVENRNDLSEFLKRSVKFGDIILLTGARDPSLADFAKSIADSFI